VAEMARVTRGLVVIEDTLFTDDRVEQAERLRDPTHVRSYTEQEWRAFLAAAGLRVTDSAVFEKHHPLEPWLTRTGCTGDAAARVRAMLAPWTRDGVFCDRKIGFRSARE
jgi:hypothetical protein